jgi:hypothetical protein
MTSLLCAEYLTWRGAKNVCFKDDAEGFEVLYGNSGLFLSKEHKVNIQDYSDFALPADCILITAPEVSSFFNDTFSSLFGTYKRNSAFTMQLCFDVSTRK